MESQEDWVSPTVLISPGLLHRRHAPFPEFSRELVIIALRMRESVLKFAGVLGTSISISDLMNGEE